MIYATGDMHGDMSLFSQKKFRNIKSGDTLIICGDFGFVWNGDSKEKKNLDKLSRKGYNICFVDGTHENFELINSYPIISFAGGKVHKIRDNVYHFIRGQVYEIEGEKIFAFGGGELPDSDMRFDEGSWAHAEIPTPEEMSDGVVNLERHMYKVDFIVTHEPSQKIKNFLRLKDNELPTVANLNTYFQDLSQNCEFTRWVFGSLHEDKFISSSQIALFQNLINLRTGEAVK